MKSSLGKLGRKLSMNRSDGKEKKDHQPSAHLEELAHASKDMQDMRNCYDSLLAAAAATANSIYEFSESLNEMGTCLLDKTSVDIDDGSGRVLSALGNMQSELQKIADTYRSYIILTVTTPTESLLSELRKVEEMKLQCDEKREAYEYMMTQQREKGILKSGKVESLGMQKLQEAQDEYNEVARLCVFRVKSLKEGQCRSLIAQAARHHAAQLDFFKKGLKALEEVDPYIRTVAEKHHIDFKLTDVPAGEGEHLSSHESTARVSSHSAPLYPEKINPSGKPKDRKFYSYALPPPVDTIDVTTKTPVSTPLPPTNTITTSGSHIQNRQHSFQDRDTSENNTSTFDGKTVKRQAYSGPLPPSKHFSGKITPNTSIKRPVTCTELPRVPVFQAPNVSPPLSSPKISELHELPRPPLFFKNQENTLNKNPVLISTGASRLPPPPLIVPRSFSIPAANQRAMALHVAKLMEPPQPGGQVAGSPPLTPISLANMKALSTVSEVASDMGHI